MSTGTLPPVISAGDLISLTADQLEASPLNPRRQFDELRLGELASDIEARGILQNLVVRAGAKGYEIVAGERRWRALRLLQEQGRLPADFSVPCKVVAVSDRALVEFALAENSQRSDVTPLEEAAGFAKLVELGADLADLEARFGRPQRFFKQRMALNDLVPEIKERIDEGRLTLADAQVFTRAAPEVQRKAINSAGFLESWRIHSLLDQHSFPVDCALFDPSECKGGIIEDLFGGEPARFVNVNRARSLQLKAIDEMADAWRDRGKEVEIMPDEKWQPWSRPQIGRYDRLWADPENPPEDDELLRTRYSEYRIVEFDDEQYASQVALLHKELERLQKVLKKKGTWIALVHSDSLTRLDTYVVTPATRKRPDEAEKDGDSLSQAHLESIREHRTAALRRAVLDLEPEAALELLTNTLILSSAFRAFELETGYPRSPAIRKELDENLTKLLRKLAPHCSDEDLSEALLAPDSAPLETLGWYAKSEHEALYQALEAAPERLRQQIAVATLVRHLACVVDSTDSPLGSAALSVLLAKRAKVGPQHYRLGQADLKRFSRSRLDGLAGESGIEGSVAGWRKAELVQELLKVEALPTEYLIVG